MGTYPRTARESLPRRGRRSACPSAEPAWPGTASQAHSPQLRSPAAAAPPPGIFSPRPLLRSAPSPRCRCGVSAGAGGATRAPHPRPLPPRRPPGARASPDLKGAADPNRRGRGWPAVSAPAFTPNVRTWRSGETGGRRAQGRPVRERDTAPTPPMRESYPARPWFYGWAGSGGRGVMVTSPRRHTCPWAGAR